MKIALIGLGKMGSRMLRRLYSKGFEVNAYDKNSDVAAANSFCGVKIFETPYNAVHVLPNPKIALLAVPAGDAVDEAINKVSYAMGENDIIADLGNSHYQHSMQRAERLSQRGIGFLDAGVSGGLEGALNGASITVGGKWEDYEKAKPVLEALACDNGLHYMGKSGNGHYTKMVHNAIEYSLMQSYAEGIELLASKGIDLKEAIEAWRNGSVIRSWLLDLISNVVTDPHYLENIKGNVGGGETGRWAVEEALRRKVPFSMATQALFLRTLSNQNNGIASKVVSALRKEFGGHEAKKK